MLTEYEPRKRGNWQDVGFSVFFTILGNIFFPVILFIWISDKSGESREAIINTSMCIGFFLSCLFNMVLLLFDFVDKHFQVVKTRIKEYFEERKLDKKKAKIWYKQSLKLDGWAFWIFFAIMLTSLIIFLTYFFKVLPQLIATI